jgi:NAD(P)-dependent dehydrogenase (short-subunit alcohol dehydrogenase family)
MSAERHGVEGVRGERSITDLRERVAFITGGVSGIGLGLAKACLRAGMRVVVTYKRDDHLQQARAELGELSAGSRFHAIAANVADREAMLAAAQEAEDRCGPVYLLCNNAGVNLFTPLDTASWEDWEWVMRVNLFGVVHGLLAFLPRMKARRSGHVLNTASMGAFITGPQAGIYAASKFAVRGLTECLRYNLQPHGIGVSLLCPGLTRSNIHESSRGRPASLGGGSRPADELTIRRIGEILSVGMDPEEVGRKALEGALRNDLYIFTHPEFKDELVALSQEIVAALPDEAVDARRLAFEQARRAAKAAR